MKRKTEPRPEPRAARADEILDRVAALAGRQQYEKAVSLLNAAGRDWRLLNAKGVCLLRLSRFDEAVRLFRDFVLQPGCTWMRPELPTVYKTNFATALLLSGHVSGCLEIMGEINDERNSTVQQIRAAIKKWESTLSLWQKFNWRCGRIEPENRPVTIDFEPGEFEINANRDDESRPAAPASPRRAG